MDLIMASKPVLPGFRFHPTDEELLMYYLKRKVMGKRIRHQVMAEVDVYRFAPWDLPCMSCLKTRDLNWYFFCPRAKKYASGSRTNRATKYGYWKSTGNDRSVQYQGRPIGKIKTLVFHRGKPPNGDRTDWVIHEYRLEDQLLANEGVTQDSYAICKIYQKSGLGPKNGEHYGARFVEEEWDDDCNVETNKDIVLHPKNDVLADSTTPTPCDSITLDPTVETSISVPNTGDQLDKMLSIFTTDGAPPENTPVDGTETELGDDFFDGLEDLGVAACCSNTEVDWSQMLAGVDLTREFIEIADLSV